LQLEEAVELGLIDNKNVLVQNLAELQIVHKPQIQRIPLPGLRTQVLQLEVEVSEVVPEKLK
jgi:hypothetical protein